MSGEHVIIGTAGHVDHGKTQLIRALTGKETDRLQEEKERGISIELGFAPFCLPSGRVAGVVDVPGHERFINNMLAGVSGIDLVLLVIDVTEGVMPQTKEHLDILQLLDINKGIVVLTKVDLAESLDWLDLVEEEVRETLLGTFLENAPAYRVSSVFGEGISDLIQGIDAMAVSVAERQLTAPLRLPVDRGFVIGGFGTVVTGTLITGQISAGDTVEVLPPGVKSRVRRVQVHGSTVDLAVAGQRVALNLPGLEKEKVERGSVVARPGYFSLTGILDCQITLLKSALRPLKNLSRIHFYLGTARVVGRAVILDREQLEPGETGLAQVRLEAPLVAQAGDRFIIRSFSPVATIGGGRVLDHKPKRHKRLRQDVVQQLQALASGDELALVLQKLLDLGPLTADELVIETRLGKDTVIQVAKTLITEGQVAELAGTYLTIDTVQKLKTRIKEKLEYYHHFNPLAQGISRAELLGGLRPKLSDKPYQALLDSLYKEQIAEQKRDIICIFGFNPAPTEELQQVADKIDELFRRQGFSPPSRSEVAQFTGVSAKQLDPLMTYLAEQGRLVKVSEDIFFHYTIVKRGINLLREHFNKQKELSLAYFRDMVKSSRRYVQALLEYYDQMQLTKRQGDNRVVWKLFEEEGE